MLRPEFMNASDTTENRFTLSMSTATDVLSFESDSRPEKWRTRGDVTVVSNVLDFDMKESLRSVHVKKLQPPNTNARTQDDLKAEKGRVQLLLDLTSQIVSNL